jgi:hypothetical protein
MHSYAKQTEAGRRDGGTQQTREQMRGEALSASASLAKEKE